MLDRSREMIKRSIIRDTVTIDSIVTINVSCIERYKWQK